MDDLKLFCGRANPDLARRVSEYLNLPLGAVDIRPFPDGELLVRLNEDIRGRDVFILQPTCSPVNENLMELLIFLDCARRASAARITAVIPYFGYARQDRKDAGRVPITAKLAANLISAAGADRTLAMDLHAAQIQGFFDIPVDNLLAEPVLSRYFGELKLPNLTIVSPDVGNVKRATVYARRLGAELAIVTKRRVSGSETEIGHVIGEVEGRSILMVDDMISTAGTVCNAARLVKDRGAERIVVGSTHPVLCGPAAERLAKSPIDEIVVTDTIPLSAEKARRIGKVRVLSVAHLIGEAIRRIHNNESVSNLFLQDVPSAS
ncbi:MAG: ribose-phosphate pyrophosphokinase [Planctomycetes bacterium]|nr:ribose-phosphate pyrophosphokinase [Planctomycetota bacterium]